MRDVAVVAFAQSQHSGEDQGIAETEMVLPVITEIKERTGLSRFGFTCSGSCDYLGAPFAFVSALDTLGAWPPIAESHVEMDGAWALYEAWVKLQIGEIDTALVYGFGKSSQGDLRAIMTQQLDPYHLAPLGVDQVSMAAMQACVHGQVGRQGGRPARGRRAVPGVRPRQPVRAAPAGPRGDDYDVAPLRPYDVAPITDGAAAIVLAAGDKARELCERPAWITGIDHRTEPHALGVRDLTRSRPPAWRGEGGATGIEVAELHAQFSHEELILREALGLDDGVTVNPSGGALSANPVMAAGLIRIGEAASRIHDGTAAKALGHAASGPCLQQNLVCVLSGENNNG